MSNDWQVINLGIVCGECYPPGRWASQEPGWCVGKMVKLAFPHSGVHSEIIGSGDVKEFGGGNRCVGTLENIPDFALYLNHGDKVIFWPAEVVHVGDGYGDPVSAN